MASGKARIDLGRVATTAIETTLNGERRRRHRRPRIQTLATGAVLLAAVRVGQKGLPSGSLKLMKLGARTLGDLREVREVLKDRLTDRDDQHEEPYDEEPYDEEEGEPEDGDDGEAEPDEDEPRGEKSDDLEPDDVDEDDTDDVQEDEEDEPRGLPTGVNPGGGRPRETPDLLLALGASRRRPPVMRSGNRGVDPASQPPEPQPAKTKSKARAR